MTRSTSRREGVHVNGPQTSFDPEAVLNALIKDSDVMRYVGQSATKSPPTKRICIAGIDGAGKTTLCQQLAHVYEHLGLEVRTFHRYRLIDNVTRVPIAMLRAGPSAGTIEIYDRSIYDNLAVWAAKTRWPCSALYPVVKSVWLLYPRFDSSIYLEADWDATRVRRPRTDPARFARLREAYRSIARAADFRTIASCNESLRAALVAITKGTTGSQREAANT